MRSLRPSNLTARPGPALRMLYPILFALALLGFACDDSAGGEEGECAAICAEQKPAVCLDETTLETYQMGDQCEEGVCAFEATQTPCPAGCETVAGEAACATASSDCADVICDQPPSPCHAPAGLCQAGICEYQVLEGLPCESDDPCIVEAACDANGACTGTTLACLTPPESVCNGDTLNVSTSPGTCFEGSCSYPVEEVSCEEGCQVDHCLGDPCAGVTCDTPPSGCFEAAGTCRDGVCDYNYDDGANCDDQDPCTEEDRCDSGSCKGTPLACNTPPPSTCKDSDTLTQHNATGACAQGSCTYASSDLPCEFGCIQEQGIGACEGDPCGFVDCDAPPLATCDGDDLLVWSLPGTCNEGECTFQEQTTTCANGCIDGAPGEAATCQAPSGLVIAELLYNSAGTPDTDAFVEIAGPEGTLLDGLTVVGINGSNGAQYNIVALSGQIGASGRYVIAHSLANPEIAAVADLVDDDIDYQNAPDSVQLRFGEEILDALGYGDFSSANFAGEGSPAEETGVDQSLSRDKDDRDTDNNAVDFIVDTPSPGAPSFWPEIAPEITLTCPATGAPDELLTFEGATLQGVIEDWTFDFGDGSTPEVLNTSSATHGFAAEGSYTITLTATTAGGQSDVETCDVVIAASETPVVYTGTEQCFSSGVSYLYQVFSGEDAPTTDGKLTVRHRGTSPYGPRPYNIHLETAPNTWSLVATTVDSKSTWQTDTHLIEQAVLEDALNNLGWIRFRWSAVYGSSSDNCLELALTYNCSDCFQCPPGELDLGLGCQSTTDDYDYTLGEHTVGYCSSSTRDNLYFPATPPATGDGTIWASSLGCDTSTMSLRMYTQVSGWVDLGSDSAGNCSFSTKSFTVPEAYLNAAIDTDHRIRVRWNLSDSCVAGMGCSYYNDPCVKNIRLTYPR